MPPFYLGGQMGTEYIYKICTACKGTGKIISRTPEEDCAVCKGKGKVLWGYVQDELEGEE